MAKTYAYAIAGGLLATFTVTPALSALLLPSRWSETDTCRSCWLHRSTAGAGFALANRMLTLGGAGLLLAASPARGAHAGPGVPAQAGGRQFLDPRDHADLDLAGGRQRLRQQDAQDHQELSRGQTVVSQHGRPDDGTDATGFFNAEFFVPLKPFDTWPPGGQGRS
jgi:cobalt-zinc-cadmium resistance protein CzcA